MSLHLEFRKLMTKDSFTQEDVKLAFDLAKKIDSPEARVTCAKIKRLAQEAPEADSE